MVALVHPVVILSLVILDPRLLLEETLAAAQVTVAVATAIAALAVLTETVVAVVAEVTIAVVTAAVADAMVTGTAAVAMATGAVAAVAMVTEAGKIVDMVVDAVAAALTAILGESSALCSLCICSFVCVYVHLPSLLRTSGSLPVCLSVHLSDKSN